MEHLRRALRSNRRCVRLVCWALCFQKWINGMHDFIDVNIVHGTTAAFEGTSRNLHAGVGDPISMETMVLQGHDDTPGSAALNSKKQGKARRIDAHRVRLRRVGFLMFPALEPSCDLNEVAKYSRSGCIPAGPGPREMKRARVYANDTHDIPRALGACELML